MILNDAVFESARLWRYAVSYPFCCISSKPGLTKSLAWGNWLSTLFLMFSNIAIKYRICFSCSGKEVNNIFHADLEQSMPIKATFADPSESFGKSLISDSSSLEALSMTLFSFTLIWYWYHLMISIASFILIASLTGLFGEEITRIRFISSSFLRNKYSFKLNHSPIDFA